MEFLSFLVGFALFIWIGSQFYDKSYYEISDNAYKKSFDNNKANKTATLSNQFMSAEQKKAHLKSEYWRLLKVNKLIQQNNRCGKCGKLSEQLDMHHLHYRTLGYETIDDVILLCSGPNGCHQKQHNYYGYDRTTDYSKLV